MDDLISRSALLSDMETLRKTAPFDVESAKQLIVYAPTIDPVKHGRWIDTGEYVTTAYGHLDIYKCSACNAEVTIDDHDSFCPNCGADMREGET